MFSPDVALRLTELGHDALHVFDSDLRSASDDEIMAYAVREGRVVVTENAADYVALLDDRISEGLALTPVAVALKQRLPRSAGAMAHALAEQLDRWAAANPDPYQHAHWLGRH